MRCKRGGRVCARSNLLRVGPTVWKWSFGPFSSIFPVTLISLTLPRYTFISLRSNTTGHGTGVHAPQTTPWPAERTRLAQSHPWRPLHSPLMLTGVRNGTCSISCRSGGNHILSGCPGSTAAVVRNPTAPPAADSSSRQLYEWQSSASGTDSIQQPQSAAAAGQRWPSTHTSRPAPSADNNSVCRSTWTQFWRSVHP